MRRIPLWAVALALVALSVQAPAPTLADDRSPTNVTFRGRLGNDVEAMTSLSPGVVALIDGYDVIAIPVPATRAGASARTSVTRLFDVRSMGQVPRGLAFDPGRERFYFGPVSLSSPPTILVTDEHGRPRPPIPLTLLPGQVTPVQFESLAYVPPDVPVIGDRIAAVLIGEDLVGRISIIRMDGTVEREIPVAPGSPAESYVTGMAFLPPDRFLIAPLSDPGGLVYQVDLAGNLSGPVITADPSSDLEGIAVLSGGRIAVAEYGSGTVQVHDANGVRLPGQDRHFEIGPGVSNPVSIAWDPPRGRFLMNASVRGLLGARHAYAVAPPFRSAVAATRDEPLVSAIGGVSYFPSTDQIALCVNAAFPPPRGIWLYDAVTGVGESRLALGSFPASAFRPVRATELPDGRVAVRAQQHPELLHLFTGTGAPDPSDPGAFIPTLLETVTLSAPQVVRGSLDLDPRSGLLLVGRWYFDLSGNAVRPLTGIPADFQGDDFVHVTTGPWAGQVAGIDSTSSELVVFRP